MSDTSDFGIRIDPPSYCGTCGRQLRRVTRKDGYNVATGEPYIAAYAECPRYRWTGGGGGLRARGHTRQLLGTAAAKAQNSA